MRNRGFKLEVRPAMALLQVRTTTMCAVKHFSLLIAALHDFNWAIPSSITIFTPIAFCVARRLHFESSTTVWQAIKGKLTYIKIMRLQCRWSHLLVCYRQDTRGRGRKIAGSVGNGTSHHHKSAQPWRISQHPASTTKRTTTKRWTSKWISIKEKHLWRESQFLDTTNAAWRSSSSSWATPGKDCLSNIQIFRVSSLLVLEGLLYTWGEGALHMTFLSSGSCFAEKCIAKL